MKILCLHGSYGSALNFKDQLGPLVNAVERPGLVDFKWINGGHQTTPPEGFEDYFGPPPLYRFVDFDGISGLDDMLYKIRDIPKGSSAAETMRLLLGDLETFSASTITRTIDKLLQIIDDDLEIEGILSYSEGATMAATLILEERRRMDQWGIPRRLKFGIFFAGWPPVQVKDDGSVKCVLADEYEKLVDIPTCHIIGCKDPYIDGAMALYNVCDEDTATLFDHGKGHTLPRDERTVQELSRDLRKMWTKVSQCA